jgi:hypothetical protein
MATEVALLDPAPTRWRRVAAPALVVGGLAAATLALHVRDPHVQNSWGLCPLWGMFGLYCPACGGLRAVNDLSNGDLLGAARSNVVLVALVPVVVWVLARWLAAAWRGQSYRPAVVGSRTLGIGLAVALVVFTVLRNLPGMALLHP